MQQIKNFIHSLFIDFIKCTYSISIVSRYDTYSRLVVTFIYFEGSQYFVYTVILSLISPHNFLCLVLPRKTFGSSDCCCKHYLLTCVVDAGCQCDYLSKAKGPPNATAQTEIIYQAVSHHTQAWSGVRRVR